MTAQSLIFTPTLTKVDGSENKKGIIKLIIIKINVSL